MCDKRVMQHNPTSRASRELIVRLGKTLNGNTALFDDVFVDPLHPQLLNRKAFDRVMESPELTALVRSLTYADADGLKRLNDTQGHEAGDEFLQDIVETWALAVRSWDRADSLIFRLGGDEFVVLWFEDGPAGLKRLQDAWDSRFYGDEDRGVTYSSRPIHYKCDAEEALRLAESDVTEAKAGRSRTEVEALRAEVEALRIQVGSEQLEQDRLRREVERLRAQLADALTDLSHSEAARDRLRDDLTLADETIRESEEARERLRERLVEAESK